MNLGVIVILNVALRKTPERWACTLASGAAVAHFSGSQEVGRGQHAQAYAHTQQPDNKAPWACFEAHIGGLEICHFSPSVPQKLSVRRGAQD